MKTYEKASILFKFAANHPKATPWDIRNAADGLYALAETYPEGSAERKLHLDKSATLYDGLATLYEKSANHPEATSWDILNAANDLNALANKYPEGSAERKKFATIARNLPRK